MPTRLFFALLIGLVLGIVLVTCRNDARAHTAASGWTYPQECCSGSMDCQMIPDDAVFITPDGYVVVLQPGQHRHVPRGGTFTFDYTINGTPNNSIKQSGDFNYHACFGMPSRCDDQSCTPIKYCIYVKPGTVYNVPAHPRMG